MLDVAMLPTAVHTARASRKNVFMVPVLLLTLLDYSIHTAIATTTTLSEALLRKIHR